MLIIEISSDGRSPLTLSELEEYNIPAPPNGFDSEINNNIVMRFDDEQQAIDYSYDLDSYANYTGQQISRIPNDHSDHQSN